MVLKHIKFDGRLLHAAPGDLIVKYDDNDDDNNDDDVESSDDDDEDEVDDSDSSSTDTVPLSETENDAATTQSPQIVSGNSSLGGDESEDDETIYPKRVTFLANIWLNHIPKLAKEYPEQTLKEFQMPFTPSINSEFGEIIQFKDNNISLTCYDINGLLNEVLIDESSSSSSCINDTSLNTENSADRQDSTTILSSTRSWKFVNSGKKYSINLILPNPVKLKEIYDLSDVFHISYNDSENKPTVTRIVGKVKNNATNQEKSNYLENEVGSDKKCIIEDPTILETDIQYKRQRRS